MTTTILVVSDVFEIAGEFSAETVAQFKELDSMIVDPTTRELVRYELELIEHLCTNTEASLTEEQLVSAAIFLRSKLQSLLQ